MIRMSEICTKTLTLTAAFTAGTRVAVPHGLNFAPSMSQILIARVDGVDGDVNDVAGLNITSTDYTNVNVKINVTATRTVRIVIFIDIDLGERLGERL